MQLRIVTAFIVGFLLTVFFAALCLVGSITFLPIVVLTLGHVRSPFALCAWAWSDCMERFVYRGLLDMHFVYHGPKPSTLPTFRIVLSNHCPTLLLPLEYWFITHRVHPRPITLQKIENLWKNVTGLPMLLCGLCIPVDRGHSGRARTAIRWGMRWLVGREGAVSIHPDGTRPTPERLERSRAEYATMNDACEWMQHSCMWRAGGTYTTVDVLTRANIPFRVMAFAAGCDRPIHSATDLVGAMFHVTLLCDTPARMFPREEQDVRRRMADLCRAANGTIQAWQTIASRGHPTTVITL